MPHRRAALSIASFRRPCAPKRGSHPLSVLGCDAAPDEPSRPTAACPSLCCRPPCAVSRSPPPPLSLLPSPSLSATPLTSRVSPPTAADVADDARQASSASTPTVVTPPTRRRSSTGSRRRSDATYGSFLNQWWPCLVPGCAGRPGLNAAAHGRRRLFSPHLRLCLPPTTARTPTEGEPPEVTHLRRLLARTSALTAPQQSALGPAASCNQRPALSPSPLSRCGGRPCRGRVSLREDQAGIRPARNSGAGPGARPVRCGLSLAFDVPRAPSLFCSARFPPASLLMCATRSALC